MFQSLGMKQGCLKCLKKTKGKARAVQMHFMPYKYILLRWGGFRGKMKRSIPIGLVPIFVSLILLFNCYLQSDANPQEQIINTNILKNEQVVPWGVKNVNAPSLWTEVTGKGVKVAVMDSGINFKHPDFGNRINKGYNAINPNELPIDDSGHGSLVTGVIAAQNNEFGVVGVAPDVELYPVKVLDKYGEGDVSDIAEGIDWCIRNKIQIINMSFAISEDKPLLRNSVIKAINSGIIIVTAASNTYGGEVGYPASYKEVISVSAVDIKNNITKNAPRGKIDFCAPGENIISTALGSDYEQCSGTSMAAPYVTGMIALLLQTPQKFGISKNGVYSNNDIFDILKNNVIDLGEKGKDNTFGEGFLALRKVK